MRPVLSAGQAIGPTGRVHRLIVVRRQVGTDSGVIVTPEEQGTAGWSQSVAICRFYFQIVRPDIVHPEFARIGPMDLIAHPKGAGVARNSMLESKVLVCGCSTKVVFIHFQRVHPGPVGLPQNSHGGDVVRAGGVVDLQPEDMVPEVCSIIPAKVDAVRVQPQARGISSRLGIPRIPRSVKNAPVSISDLPASPVGEKVRILPLEGL